MSNIPEAIEQLERRLSVPLPDDYRAFLEGGCQWDDDQRFLSHPNIQNFAGAVEVNCFYLPCRDESVVPTVSGMLDAFQDREVGDGMLPPGVMPIAGPEHDDEEIVLFVKGEHRGKVAVKNWEHLDRGEPDLPELGLWIVADSFNDFMRILSTEDPTEE